MATWKTYDDEPFGEDKIPSSTQITGAPMQSENCSSPKKCWEVFMDRYQAPAKSGEARLLNFVKLFAHAQELAGKSREEMFALSDSYFVSWLNLAGTHA